MVFIIPRSNIESFIIVYPKNEIPSIYTLYSSREIIRFSIWKTEGSVFKSRVSNNVSGKNVYRISVQKRCYASDMICIDKEYSWTKTYLLLAPFKF